MKKLIILTMFALSSCGETVVWEVYQNGKIIDRVCREHNLNRVSYSYGGSYYKKTSERCEETK